MSRKGAITFQGNPLTLAGEVVEGGAAAPDFTVSDNDLKPVSLSDFKGKIVIISSVPSLDTPVCELQTKRFNEEAAKLDAQLLTISMDLPFAQARFCKALRIENSLTLSDYKDRSFAKAFGLLIEELGLLARAVFVIDKGGRVFYRQLVTEITQEPNYDEVLESARKAGA